MSLLQDRSAPESAGPPRLSLDDRDRLFPRYLVIDLLVFALGIVGLGLSYGVANAIDTGSFAAIGSYLGVSVLFAVQFLVVASIVVYVVRRPALRDRTRTRAIREALVAAQFAALDASEINPRRANPAHHG